MKERLTILRVGVLCVLALLFVGSSAAQAGTSESASPEQPAPIQIGEPLHVVNPKVPKELRKKYETVVFAGAISAAGEFSNLTVLGGDQVFANIALDAVRKWRYSPSIQYGKPVDGKVYVVISADHGKVSSRVEPELPIPTQPREPIKELFASERLFRVGATVKAPKVLNAPDPEYSELARRAKYQGVAVLGVIVGPDGNPQDVWVVKKLGLGLDQKAIDAVRTLKFDPATRDGQTVAVLLNVEVRFRVC